MVSGITLQIGSRTLAVAPMVVAKDFYGTEPLIVLGYKSFRDRRLFLSFRTGSICVTNPL